MPKGRLQEKIKITNNKIPLPPFDSKKNPRKDECQGDR
jgi:hypothetical protein